jgi:23S rRNA (uracil1939-C5)-methyltransferase
MFEEIVTELRLTPSELEDIRVSKAPKNQYCPYFEVCGGCQLLTWPYEKQVEWKKNQLKDLFKSKDDIDFIGAEQTTAYRHKNSISFKQQGLSIIAGFYKPKSHQLININHCLIQHPAAEKIFLSLKDIMKKNRIEPYDEDRETGVLRHALVRVSKHTNQILLVLVVGQSPYPGRKNFIAAIRKAHPEITTIIENVHPIKSPFLMGKKEEVVFGKGFIQEKMNDKLFNIQSRTFFQIHIDQAEHLFNEVIKYSDLKPTDVCIDAYAGVGVIGMLLADKVKQVISVESNPDSIQIGKKNAELNGIKNIQFVHKDATEWLKSSTQAFDVLVMDPPREGAGYAFMDTIATKKPNTIIYISCNPVTQVKDLQQISKSYKVVKRFGVDLFPQTIHVESVVILKKVTF